MNFNKKVSFQMHFLGIIAFSIGILTMLSTTLAYRLPELTSISESATIGLGPSMILPFCLGSLVIYFGGYKGYCTSEFWLTKVMAIGFALVALFPTDSEYAKVYDKISPFAVTPSVSGIFHALGATAGFLAMFIWVAFYFTRTHAHKRMTPMKRKRNVIYIACAGMMFAGLIIFALSIFNIMGNLGIFISECLVLMPAGFAIFIKGGGILRDKN